MLFEKYHSNIENEEKYSIEIQEDNRSRDEKCWCQWFDWWWEIHDWIIDHEERDIQELYYERND